MKNGQSTPALAVCILALLAAGCGRNPSVPPATAAAGAPRIVSLAPNLTEILCEIGAADTLVGRTTVCTRPANLVSNIPLIGGFGSPSLELLLARKPTLVLHVDLEDPAIARNMEALKIPHESIPCATLDDIPKTVTRLGQIAGRVPEADALAARIRDGIATLRTSAPSPSNAPLVFVEIWSDPLITCGRKSFIADLVRLAGGRNLGDEIDSDYAEVSSEWVVTRDPEVILYLGMTQGQPGRERVESRSGWALLRAVRNGRVYDQLNTDILTRPGPHVFEGVAQMRECIAGGKATP